MASDIADAIARAQRDVEHDCRYVMPGKCEPCDNLAALGPPSVALAVALDEVKAAMGREGTGHVANPETAFAHCLGCKAIATADAALQDWADAQQGGAGGAR